MPYDCRFRFFTDRDMISFSSHPNIVLDHLTFLSVVELIKVLLLLFLLTHKMRHINVSPRTELPLFRNRWWILKHSSSYNSTQIRFDCFFFAFFLFLFDRVCRACVCVCACERFRNSICTSFTQIFLANGYDCVCDTTVSLLNNKFCMKCMKEISCTISKFS